MDEPYFGLKCWPFPTSPDVGSYYPSTSHENALARLQAGIKQGEGIVLLVGEPGFGKTLLGQALAERLEEDRQVAFLTNSHVGTRAGLLQAILFELSLPYQGMSEQEMRLALTEHLLRAFADGRRTLLIVDEAHLLAPDLLEELRLLGNLDARHGKAMQIVLIAQPAILTLLREPELASLRQRLVVRSVLNPLEEVESADYVCHQVRRASGKESALFSGESLELIARATQGVPRLINQLAHQALLLAAQTETEQVDVEIVIEVLNSLGWTLPPQELASDDAQNAAEVYSFENAIQPASAVEGVPGYRGVSFAARTAGSVDG
jgi:type II secretory pathway predicted ATPase ExeA